VVLNASGGVGSFAVQFARDRGCTVVGTCSGKNKELVESKSHAMLCDSKIQYTHINGVCVCTYFMLRSSGLGATVVDYTAGDLVQGVRAVMPEGADLVFDCFGGQQAVLGLDMIKEGGIVVSIANFEIGSIAAAAGKRGKAFLVRSSGMNRAEHRI
jgi:NADPH:quinone reductase-like Zn-dependent oxidoreductase